MSQQPQDAPDDTVQTPDDLQRKLVRDVAAYEVDPPAPARVEEEQPGS